MAIIWISCGALGCTGPLDPSGTGLGGIWRLDGGAAVGGVDDALAACAGLAAAVVDADGAGGAGALRSSHARTASATASSGGAA
jgi:hypothetical protein